MYSDQKKLLKLAILALFGDFSAENLNKTEVGTKSFAKNTFLKKITKLTFVSNFTVNRYFPQQWAGQILNWWKLFQMS